MTCRVTPSMPPSQWPWRMTTTELAVVMGRSPKAVMNAVSAGRFWPPPIADTDGQFLKPYLFDRATVQGFLEGKLPRPRRVRLVTTRRRLAAASSRRSA